jgi:hypothetical protein
MSAFSKLESLIDSLLSVTRSSTPVGCVMKNISSPGTFIDYPCKAVIVMPYNTGTYTAPAWNYGSLYMTGTSISGNLIWVSAPVTIPCTNANQISMNNGYLSYIILV